MQEKINSLQMEQGELKLIMKKVQPNTINHSINILITLPKYESL